MMYKDTQLVNDKAGMRTKFLNSTASVYPIMGFAEGKSLKGKQETVRLSRCLHGIEGTIGHWHRWRDR